MIKDIETIGLKVENITPYQNAIDVDVNSSINISFNAELNTGTIIGNISVLEDSEMLYDKSNGIGAKNRYTLVRGSVSYKDRIITFKPSKPLNEDSRYLICVKENGITDICGNKLPKEYIGVIYTESKATISAVNILSPKFGCICQEVPQFTWGDKQTKGYVYQLSREETFETLIVDKVIKNDTSDYAKTSYKPTIILPEGLYYVRVKSINGHWSEPLQFFIKKSNQGSVTSEDVTEQSILQELDDTFDRPLDVLEVFPHDSSVQVDTKINIMYVKLTGKVRAEDIDFDNTFVSGELFDPEDTSKEHGVVDGDWTVIYDKHKDESYIVFTPKEL